MISPQSVAEIIDLSFVSRVSWAVGSEPLCLVCTCVPACVCLREKEEQILTGVRGKQTYWSRSFTAMFDLLFNNETLKWGFLMGRNQYSTMNNLILPMHRSKKKEKEKKKWWKVSPGLCNKYFTIVFQSKTDKKINSYLAVLKKKLFGDLTDQSFIAGWLHCRLLWVFLMLWLFKNQSGKA